MQPNSTVLRKNLRKTTKCHLFWSEISCKYLINSMAFFNRNSIDFKYKKVTTLLTSSISFAIFSLNHEPKILHDYWLRSLLAKIKIIGNSALFLLEYTVLLIHKIETFNIDFSTDTTIKVLRTLVNMPFRRFCRQRDQNRSIYFLFKLSWHVTFSLFLAPHPSYIYSLLKPHLHAEQVANLFKAFYFRGQPPSNLFSSGILTRSEKLILQTEEH